MNDQAEKLRLLAKSLQEKIRKQIFSPPAPCRVITVTSGKGGVGKTNLALALSLALTNQKYRVILLDADMGLANVDVILGVVPEHNLSHVVSGEKTIREIIHEGPGGLKIIPGSSGVEELANLDSRGLSRLLDEVATLEQNFDYLIIDTGAGISSQVMAFTLAAEDILLVTTPEPTSIADAYGLIKVFKKRHGKGRLRLIVNMVRSEQEGREVAQKLVKVVAQFLKFEIDVVGYIPSDRAVEEAVRRNQSFITAFPRAPASLNIIKIASALGGFPPQEAAHGIQGFIRQIVSFLQGEGENPGGEEGPWQQKSLK